MGKATVSPTHVSHTQGRWQTRIPALYGSFYLFAALAEMSRIVVNGTDTANKPDAGLLLAGCADTGIIGVCAASRRRGLLAAGYTDNQIE